MNLRIKRRYKCNGYTIGSLYVNGTWFCDTLEDADRGLAADMPIEELYERKLKSVTAIPTGAYFVDLSTKSPKFGKVGFYDEVCRGQLPRLCNVPAFECVLIHCGNTAKDTDGCIIVGENKIKGQVINSKATFRKLYPILKDAARRGETITIRIE